MFTKNLAILLVFIVAIIVAIPYIFRGVSEPVIPPPVLVSGSFESSTELLTLTFDRPVTATILDAATASQFTVLESNGFQWRGSGFDSIIGATLEMNVFFIGSGPLQPSNAVSYIKGANPDRNIVGVGDGIPLENFGFTAID